jgi:hypothetical protein
MLLLLTVRINSKSSRFPPSDSFFSHARGKDTSVLWMGEGDHNRDSIVQHCDLCPSLSAIVLLLKYCTSF